jgi:hypothetical protein
MFGSLAPKLRDMGWQSLIPIKAGEKSPAISGWQLFNTLAPSDEQFDTWTRLNAKCGIGLAFGPDHVIGADLDFTAPDKAAEAHRIMEKTLGATPLIRVGRAPKLLALYRAAAGLHVDGKAFGGFEIYSRSGQCLLHGIHPVTGQPYEWPEESPEHVSPDDLPLVSQAQITLFIAEMGPLREDSINHHGATVRNTGRAATWLSLFSEMTTPSQMIDASCAGILGVGYGARHFTMQAVVTALVTRGIAPEEFQAEIERAYFATLDAQEVQKRRHAVAEAARWADDRIWGGSITTPPVSLKIVW